MWNEAGQRLIEFCQENTLVTANTLFKQHRRRLYIWTSDWLYFCSQRWRSSIQCTKTRPEADCGSDHELVIAKFSLKLKKVRKTTRPKYIKSLTIIQWKCKIDSGIRSYRQSAWRTMDRGSWRCTGGSDQNHSQEKEMQEGKMVVWGGLNVM